MKSLVPKWFQTRKPRTLQTKYAKQRLMPSINSSFRNTSVWSRTNDDVPDRFELIFLIDRGACAKPSSGAMLDEFPTYWLARVVHKTNNKRNAQLNVIQFDIGRVALCLRPVAPTVQLDVQDNPFCCTLYANRLSWKRSLNATAVYTSKLYNVERDSLMRLTCTSQSLTTPSYHYCRCSRPQ